MPYDIFIKLGSFTSSASSPNAIRGESQDKTHSGEIEAHSVTWGYTQHLTIGSASTGAGAGKADFQDVVFMKSVDSTSPLLYQFLASGKHFDKVVITFRKSAAGAAAAEFLVYTLGLVYVSSIEGTADGDGDPTENVTLTYGAATWQVLGPKDTELAKPIGWSKVKNISVVDVAAGY